MKLTSKFSSIKLQLLNCSCRGKHHRCWWHWRRLWKFWGFHPTFPCS